ncbi:MAG: hypothetical protein ACYC3I_12325 [Gemmataceae bacterium]
MTDVFDTPVGVEEPWMPPIEEDVVELPLLLPGWQVSKLETVAYQRGLTAAEMVRHLLRDFLMVAPCQRRASST